MNMERLAGTIVNALDNYLTEIKKNYSEERFDYEIDHGFLGESERRYEVDVAGYYKNEYDENEQTKCVLLRFYIVKEYGQIQMTNIFLPAFMHYKGIGKKLISIVFTVAKKSNYDLFLVDMVNSFYRRMINRNALPCDGCVDAVQIISTTKLD